VPKVHNKPIKSPRNGSSKKEQSNQRLPWSGAPDCPVCHRTVSGAPGSSTLNLPPSGIRGGCSAIIHRTVRCSTGLSGVPSGATAPSANGRLQRYSEQCNCARSDCPVHHRTVRWARCQKLQWSEPNGLVTWLAHRTVRCTIRQRPSPTVILVVRSINTPKPPHFNVSKFSAIKPHTRALYFIPRHKQRDQILSQVRNHSKEISD
jgi:hypothetical protein